MASCWLITHLWNFSPEETVDEESSRMEAPPAPPPRADVPSIAIRFRTSISRGAKSPSRTSRPHFVGVHLETRTVKKCEKWIVRTLRFFSVFRWAFHFFELIDVVLNWSQDSDFFPVDVYQKPVSSSNNCHPKHYDPCFWSYYEKLLKYSKIFLR